MKKIVKVLAAVISCMAIVVACLPTITDAKAVISKEAAADICEIYNVMAEIDYAGFRLDLDREDDEAYYFHYYEVVDNGEFSHTATLNWYKVDKKTGDLYDDIMRELLLDFDYAGKEENAYWIEFTGYDDCVCSSLSKCEAYTSSSAPKKITLNGNVKKADRLMDCSIARDTKMTAKTFKVAKNCQYVTWEDTETIVKYKKAIKPIVKYADNKNRINMSGIDTRMKIKNGKIVKIIYSA